jgi:predicted unusual protein kinase regulating ubiquinone biosynthesis (AarF/ABC1/UbiB family)
VTFGRIYLGIKTNQWIARRLAPRDMKRRWSRFNRQSAWSIYDTAIDLRGMILKGCQFVGSRADVMPPEYVDVLSQLQDRVPAHPIEVVRELVEDELDAPLERLFESFSEEPIAAASLAQVHDATLPGGRRVAVKVQYPEIAGLVHSDLANLKALFRAVGFVERDFDLMPLITELGEHVPRELDFIHEGRNSEAVAKFFEGRDDIHVPSVHWDYTTARVLVTDYVDGIKISDRDALSAAGVDRAAVMQTLVEAYCEQILVHGLFHADPHPGNLMVLPPEQEDGAPRLVFIDFGLTKQLPPAFRETVLHFAAALLQGDPARMAQALVELGFETREDPEEALLSISTLLLEVAKRLRHQTWVDPAVVREAGEELPKLIRENPIVRMPGHVVLLGRVIALLSGLGHTLGVRIDMLRTILPYAMGQRPAPPISKPARTAERD